MTHELKHIVQQFEEKKKKGQKAVLATVVSLDGSSYRRPGVRMLIFDTGQMVGAVSGGCVEKEIWRQAESVFSTGTAKVMVYDGRYRLGCEGILYILIEVFNPDKSFFTRFWNTIQKRTTFSINSFYKKEQGVNISYHTLFDFEEGSSLVNQEIKTNTRGQDHFEQQMDPCFQLVLIGAEHDAVQLCKYASLTGWEVTIVANPKEEKTTEDFPGAHQLVNSDPEAFQLQLDRQTAVVVMTHSFVKDLQYLIALRDERIAYIGLLGPFKRREKLFDELLERYPETTEEFLDQIHGPAGIDIGAETPQEIAISILSEILSVVNKIEPSLLKNKLGKIHTI